MFGKEVAEEYTNEVELGTVKTDMPIGTYVNRDEFIGGILTLFKEKKPSWLTRIGDKVLRDLEKDEEELEDSVDKILEKNYEKIK